MLEILSIKSGNFEINDPDKSDERFLNYWLSRILSIVEIILVLAFIYFIYLDIRQGGFWLIIVTILLFIAIILNIRITYNYFLLLDEEIYGVILQFDENRKLISLTVRRWQNYYLNDFVDTDVRFNQAVGYKIIELEDEYEIQIIVDANFPGIAIFRTYDLYVVAEFVLMMREINPNQKELYFENLKGDTWSEESLEQFDKEFQVAKVPWSIKRYLHPI